MKEHQHTYFSSKEDEGERMMQQIVFAARRVPMSSVNTVTEKPDRTLSF